MDDTGIFESVLCQSRNNSNKATMSFFVVFKLASIGKANGLNEALTGRLAQLVERRTREHNVSGLYRCGFESPAGQLKLLIVSRMRR